MLTFGITCNSITSGLSAKASANVTDNPASAASAVQIAPAAINFGTEAVGSTSKSQSVTLTNGGTTAIPLTAASVTSNFSLQSDGCGASLAAGAHCTLVVAFSPTITGALTGTLTVPSGGTNYQVALSGLATAATEPEVTVALSASATTITAGQSTTLTWKSSNAASCTATGGGTDDSWVGTKATSGSQTVTEASALTSSSVVLTFRITCNSTTSGLSDSASITVTENAAAASSGGTPTSTSSGGGGALNPLSLAFLAAIFALRRVRTRVASR
jgi:Abnormal spindle-like microcephaly-assoc'd, ASPM-SPD-2-Hydin